jgi:N-methylhydantoinase B
MSDDSIFYELEIVRGRLQSIVDEAGAAILRTAFSNTVREAHDFACAILSPEGHTVVQSRQSIPAFIGTMSHTWRAMNAVYNLQGLEPGDIIATNDPWLGTGQLNDITLVSPVFEARRLVGFSGVVAHMADIGGNGHTGHGGQMFEEGLRLPVVKLGTSLGLDDTVIKIVTANVRRPNELMGDLSAMLNASAVIGAQLAELSQEIGGDRLGYMCEELERRSEAYMRRTIAALPDGSYRAQMASEGDTSLPFSIHLKVTVEGDRMVLDLDGTSPQVREGINSSLSYSYSYSIYGCKCLLAPELPFNDGLFRPIEFLAPEGSVVNCTFPAAGSGRSTVGHHLPTLIFNALETCASDAIIGECGAPPTTVSVRGIDPASGELFAQTLHASGGFGARATKDGLIARFPTNVQVVSAEMLEIYNPILVVGKEVVRDSGGAGQHRGGLGQRAFYKMLANESEVFVRAQWVRKSPKGVLGGRPGGRAAVEINGKKIRRATQAITLRKDDVLMLQTPGSGGYGSPKRRAREKVASDVRRGYVSASVARTEYGWSATQE